MKKRAGLAVILLFLISALGGIAQAKTLTAAEKAKLKYAQYLNSHSTEGMDGYVEYFAAVLLDDNTTPDLFEMTDKVASVSFLNGGAYKGTERAWADMKVLYYIYPKTGVFSYSVYDSDGSTRPEFLYRRLVVRTNGKKDVYVASMVRNDNDEDKYFDGPKENTAALITKAEFNSNIKGYTGSVKAKRIVFYENTIENRKKYLGDTGEIASITLSPVSKTLALKGTAVLTAAVKNADSSVVSWVSDNPKVVSVEPDSENENTAVITAKKGGIATVTASVSGVSASCKVTVDAPSIELDQTSADLFMGKTLKLTAAVTGPSKTVTWKSSNAAAASVSGGVVTAKKAGKTTITATANGLTASCTVNVRAMKENVTKLTAVKAGKTYIIKFSASANPVIVTRKGNKLYVDDKAVLTLHDDYPAYEIYLTDLDTDDSTKEVLELYRDDSGRSAVNVYRYASGKLAKQAGLSGKKGASVRTGFAYKKGQVVKTPGNGTIVTQQDLLLGGKEKVTVQMKYEVNGKKMQVIQYDEDESITLMSVKSTKNKLGKALTLLKKPGSKTGTVKYKKNTSYKPMKLAVMNGKAYLKVTIKGKKGWFGFGLSNVVYQ